MFPRARSQRQPCGASRLADRRAREMDSPPGFRAALRLDRTLPRLRHSAPAWLGNLARKFAIWTTAVPPPPGRHLDVSSIFSIVGAKLAFVDLHQSPLITGSMAQDGCCHP